MRVLTSCDCSANFQPLTSLLETCALPALLTDDCGPALWSSVSARHRGVRFTQPGVSLPHRITVIDKATGRDIDVNDAFAPPCLIVTALDEVCPEDKERGLCG